MVQLQASSKILYINTTFQGKSSDCNHMVYEKKSYSLILTSEAAALRCKLVEDFIKKNDTGNPRLRFFNTLPEVIDLTVGDVTFKVGPGQMSPNMTVERSRYSEVQCSLGSKPCSPLDLGLLDFGASYTVMLIKVKKSPKIPQYVLMTAGEVMFSITGLEFSYSQAPATMKSVLQAGWLLTVAFGNVIVLIVAEGAGLEQWIEFLLFACLLLGVCIIFSIMAHFYTYVDPDQMVKLYVGNSDKIDDDDANETGRKRNDMALKETSTKM
ncbi:hypothetical protein fugu_000653 [Takifugu bimaculatus]|uniref:Solute carrier family 15 member 2 n=1 Tax=Takifugu bimaculatus TaxID=433685 RepID=A0A4Z2CHR9_9TELE|nr:hypothetical protein fugu_000653 [Takifugu bimaculatus]